ncbi:hypothetical protein SUGI_0984690 [Cryptomeria japonica]|nr:hypothetical protein SUGI_0984690 [Cryptomeria japonica]
MKDSSALREKLGGLLGFGCNNYGSEDRCSIRKIIRNKCNRGEVEPGKFVRKYEKTQEVFRSCVGRRGRNNLQQSIPSQQKVIARNNNM